MSDSESLKTQSEKDDKIVNKNGEDENVNGEKSSNNEANKKNNSKLEKSSDETKEKVQNTKISTNKNNEIDKIDAIDNNNKSEKNIKVDKDSSDNSGTTPVPDLNVPPKETPELNLGKGKRARIPNKRYSDIMLSPSSRTISKPTLENGDLDIEDDLHKITTPAPKKQKLVDITNPNYLKPFKFGWKRELVYRAQCDSANRRIPGDIYYYTPQGKKIRSMRELSEILKTKELTIEDFTFAKEAIGIDDPEKEIIRDAKSWQKKNNTKSGKSTKVLSPKLQQTSKNKTVTTDSTKKTQSKNITIAKSKTVSKVQNKKAKIEDENMEHELSSIRPKRKATKTSSRLNMDSSKSSNKRNNRSVTTTHESTPVEQSSVIEMLNEKIPPTNIMSDNYLQALSYGYKTLLHIFQYLKVQDILRASCVCSMWRYIASHPSLWRTVRMKNSQVHSFDGLANSLKKHGTIHLDLRKMLLPANGGSDDIWSEFSKAIKKVDSLRKIELCRCPAIVVEQLPSTNPNLEVINAVTIKCESMNLDNLKSLKNLKELRLKSTSGLTLTTDLNALKELTSLKHLSLTSIKDLDKVDLSVIGSLTNLESLDLGECTNFPKNFGEEILVKLTGLEKLRLEKGQDNCHTFEILDAVKKMTKLEQLELVNFDIKSGFDVALGNCSNIKKLLLIPTYISQSATTNHMVLGGVLRLQSTLSYFVWGITLELLRVTELFIDQCEDPDKKEQKSKEKKTNGDSIPVLKPVPLLNKDEEIQPADDPPQVEILPLPNLQKLLLHNLPTTRVKILKIPFHATWRQSITDTVNP